jgi:hypothetical protein
MTMNDGAILSMVFSSTYNPANYVKSEDKSESFTVFQASSSTIGNIVLDLPDLSQYSENLYYDYSNINNGVITIRYQEATGIKPIAADEMVSVDVISMLGVKMAEYKSSYSEVKSYFHKILVPQGIYILLVKSENGNKQSISIRK